MKGQFAQLRNPAVHDPEWIRVMRRRDIFEHRISELQGLMEGRRIGRNTDGGLAAVAEWIEIEETLWETWPCSRLREILSPCREPEWASASPETVARIEQAVEQYEGPLAEEARAWAEAPDAPFDENTTMVFTGKRFVFSGVFRHRERHTAEEATGMLGGHIRSDVARVTDFLIVGARCQPGWKHKRRGRKIENIVRWREEDKTECRIVSEEQFWDAIIEHATRMNAEFEANEANEPNEPQASTA